MSSKDAEAIYLYYFKGLKIAEINNLNIKSVSATFKKYSLNPGRGRNLLGSYQKFDRGSEITKQLIDQWILNKEYGFESFNDFIQQFSDVNEAIEFNKVNEVDHGLISEIVIKKFKKINEVRIGLGKITVLVGSNNAGKTSVLQAIQFFNSVAQAGAKSHQNHKKWFSNIDSETYSASIDPDALLYTPSNDVYSLHYGEKLKQGRKIEFEIKDSFGNETKIRLSPGKNKNIMVNFDGKKILRSLEGAEPFAIFSPGIAGISAEEEFRNAGVIRKAAIRGDANSVFRNIIWALSELGGDVWDAFIKDLNDIFPDVDVNVRFNPDLDTNISVEIARNGEFNSIPVDLSGTGLLQCIHILSYIHLYNPRMIILDEPDSHIHPENQVILAKLLSNLAEKRENFQVILATHSRYIVETLMERDAQIN